MSNSDASFESELRISPKWVLTVLMVFAMAVLFMSDDLSDLSHRAQVQLFGLLLFALLTVTWLLDNWRAWAGRWFLIVGVVAAILLANSWQSVPGTLALMAIPTALAAVLIGLPAAAGTALGETVLLTLLPKHISTSVNPAEIGIALVAIWGMLGVMCAVYQPVYRVARRSWEYYRRAQGLLKDARDRAVDLQQALDDLADANLQLKRMNELAQALRQAAEDARVAKERFVANVSHELRTPLNMITGFCELIVQAPETYGSGIPSALLADLAIIRRNGEHLSNLIDDVLDLSQIEAGRMALTKERTTVEEIVESAVTAVRPLFDAKGLYLETTIAEDLPSVFCDRTRFREVVLNLLSNAGRFTECGGVHVRVWREGDDVVASVTDTGPGIPAEDLSRIFQPFQQLDGSVRRRYGGSGLGLSISKHLVELHGGTMWIESQQDVGTTVSFRIPITPPSPPADEWSRWLTPDWEYRQRTRCSKAPLVKSHPRLVVQDPSGMLRRLLTRYLHDIEIVSVTNLEQALRELSDVPARALLVNDVSVGRALERLNQPAVLVDGVPAIICSVPGTHNAADTLGVSDYLVKPVSRDELLATLGRLSPRGNTILIADDERDVLQLFRRMLGSAERKYRILRARNGLEAMNILREQHPDVILLDLVMPNMDGFHLLEAKSQDPALCDIPVVVISARDPVGQPIVSSALAVTQAGGLSIRDLLVCIEAITSILSAPGQAGDRVPTIASAG